MNTLSKTKVIAASRLQAYYTVTKPGIVYGNCLTAVAGYLFASSLPYAGSFDWPRFLATIAGTALIIACAGVLNNCLDYEIDQRMERTRDRPVASGAISQQQAIVWAAVLGAVGLLLLVRLTNTLTVYAGLAGLYLYLAAYSVSKRRSPAGTLVGSLSGAVPVLAGYTAATGRLDWTAAMLFIAMALWQLPHFYAIAIYRLKDYRKAGLPVLPAVQGTATTQRHINFYIAAFMIACASLSLAGPASWTFFGGMLAINSWWLYHSLTARGRAHGTVSWAKQSFRLSLVVVLVFSILLSVNNIVP